MKPIRWEDYPAIPRLVASLLGSLRFSGAREDWPASSEAEWTGALHYCDRNQLTLMLPRAGLPDYVVRRLDKSAADNQERVRRLKETFAAIDGALKMPFLVLKGFASWDQFTSDPLSRLQYDLDLYCPDTATAARDALSGLGYEPISGAEKFPTDHLPSMVLKTGWQWQGDFFDPEIPVSVDLHFQLWDEATEGFPAPGIEQFWPRRVPQSLDGLPYQALHPADALGYAALHLLRHLLRGDVRVANIYELAWFLDRNAANDAFWTGWRDLHDAEFRRLQAIGFRLAAAWFDCRLSPAARAEVDLLSRPIRRWFELCAASPAEAFFRPNKDELWLHLRLLDSFRKKSSVLRRRLFPTRLPGPLDSVFIPEKKMTPRLRLQKRWQYALYVAGRGVFHARALLPTLSRMFRIRR